MNALQEITFSKTEKHHPYAAFSSEKITSYEKQLAKQTCLVDERRMQSMSSHHCSVTCGSSHKLQLYLKRADVHISSGAGLQQSLVHSTPQTRLLPPSEVDYYQLFHCEQ